MSDRRCAHCGRVLVYGTARFCSRICRQRAYRRRKAGVPEDAPPIPPALSGAHFSLEELYIDNVARGYVPAPRHDVQEAVT